MDPQRIAQIDSQHIWHPYAPIGETNRVVLSACGTTLTLGDGSTVLDAMSSWWAAAHGHNHPRLVVAATRQLESMSHVMFGGLTHEPAARLTENLMELTDWQLPRVFYADSGSVSVEVAIKMALQYARGQGHPERTRLLTWRHGYHGDTFAAMSACDPDTGMHSLWDGVVAKQQFAPAPPPRGATPAERETYLAEFASHITAETAAVIIEPVVQGAGGMRFHDHELVTGIRALCDEHGLVMIADEIATGFGRTGDLFTSFAADAVPDIMCVGKALTGGMMTLAATLAKEHIAQGLEPAAVMHGPTFMANPLATAAAAEATQLIREGEWREQVPRVEAELETGLRSLAEYQKVADVRVLGAIGVVELHEPAHMAAATTAALREGVWIRPFGKLLYIMPPFISTEAEVATMCRGLSAAVDAA